MADYRPVNFHFLLSTEDDVVRYSNGDSVSFQGEDIEFQSVSGLSVQLETETYKENGENGHHHIIPTKARYTDLILKRGIFRPGESGFTDWFKKAFEQFQFKPINLQIHLLDEEHKPLMFWKVIHAWPKSWKIADLDAEKGAILIETLEIRYNRFEFKLP